MPCLKPSKVLIELVAATPGVSEEAREERCDFIAWLLKSSFYISWLREISYQRC